MMNPVCPVHPIDFPKSTSSFSTADLGISFLSDENKAKGLATILLVTDKFWTSQSLLPLLESGYEFFVVPMTAQGMDLTGKPTPDLILCDAEENIEFALASLQRALTADTPFIVISSSYNRQQHLPLMEQGVDDFLIAPFTTVELKSKVRHFLDVRTTRRLLQQSLKQSLHRTNTPLAALAEELTLQCQELKRLNRAKHDFLAVLSHELRNPLNVIAGFSDILLSEFELPEEAFRAAKAIFRSAQIQNKLVGDLLDISRSSAGKMSLDLTTVDLGALLQENLSSFMSSAAKKNIQVVTELSNGPSIVHGDPTRLAQVIWNLFSNALKFTPAEGTIKVQTVIKENRIDLEVLDSGVGIDPHFLPFVFEEFHQQDASTTKKFGGLGLGLAIVRHIVELHSGHVSAASEGVGKGAQFKVSLPLVAH